MSSSVSRSMAATACRTADMGLSDSARSGTRTPSTTSRAELARQGARRSCAGRGLKLRQLLGQQRCPMLGDLPASVALLGVGALGARTRA